MDNQQVLSRLKDYPNYSVSPEGYLYSHNRKRKLKGGIDKYGYIRFTICNEEGRGYFTLHRLVALAFVPNSDPIGKPTVNHIDGNKLNNHYSNFEWMDNSEQQIHAHQLGLSKVRKGSSCNFASINEEVAHAICKMIVAGSRNFEIVKELNVGRSTVSHIKNRNRWTDISSQYNW